MGVMNKIKRIFRKENQIPGQKKEILPPSKWKYENMILFAPSIQIFYTDNKKNFYISAYDENNNPIINETIHIDIDGEESDIETNFNGNAKIFVDFEPGTHNLEITYPNGEYSQKIISKIRVKEKRTEKSGKTSEKDKNGKKEVLLSIPNMKMYVNNEGNYYARLREKKGYKPIEGEEIIFEINDEIFKSKTDEEGFARLPIKNIHKGKHKVKARYEGSSQYKSTSKKSMLTMMRRDIDEEVVIDVEHLTMEFKVTKDKIDTLKELIIRTLKRNKETDETITIIDDISFKVYKGDRLGILGFNGAGKSTLLKIMSGIYEPTSGSIKTYGKIAPLLELGAGFDKNYSGKNNIFLNGSLLSIDEKTLHEKYDEIVEFSELGEFIDFPIKNYSSGMRTKLGFSIATQINPDILIIDEILSVGDIKFKKKSGDKINSMMKDGVTVLLVSHSIKQMKDICDRCIWLENGQIKMDGDADEVCDAYINGAEKDIKKNR